MGDLYDDIFDTPKRAKGINSKLKGQRGENDACKSFLTPWTGNRFCRTPKSGGMGWSVEFASGDVINLDRRDFEFVVEVKSYDNLALTPILRSNSHIYVFWEQVKRDSETVDKHPVLIARENGMPKGAFVIFFNAAVSLVLEKKFYLLPKYEGLYGGTEYIYGYDSVDVLKIEYKKLIKFI